VSVFYINSVIIKAPVLKPKLFLDIFMYSNEQLFLGDSISDIKRLAYLSPNLLFDISNAFSVVILLD
jgi:hypothetical protein